MNSHSYGPVVQRALLTRELEKIRKSRKETQQIAAKSLKWSLSKFIRVEGGDVRLSQADLEYLLRHYNVTDEGLINYLSALAEGGRKRGWWQEYETFDDKAFTDYVGFETDASEIRLTQGANIPGLLQIEPYMQAIAAAYGAEGDQIAGVVALRKARQERMASRSIKQIYILDEAALRRKVGNTMPDQLRHLIALAEKPHIAIHVITFGAGPHFGMRGPFAILSFDRSLDLEDVFYLESARRGDLIIGPGNHEVQGDPEDVAAARVDDVAYYRAGFDSMMNVALDRSGSVKFIAEVLEEMPARPGRLRSWD